MDGSPGVAAVADTGAAHKRPKLLVFIVAYNAEKTIESVLDRIPDSLCAAYDVEVLAIDDGSKDGTFERADEYRRNGKRMFPIHVLFNPKNLGYGGNQKVGYRYAVAHGFDMVALVHGDGQYAPERLPDLVGPIARGEAEAVFGSRMMVPFAALKGGMPLYKYVGNTILTLCQNILLGTRLSEFHSGYRIYSAPALAKLPLDMNTNDFHFDTEIIIQLVFAKMRIKELPIPTYYGDEICHVNGMRYAGDVMIQTTRARLQKMRIGYDPKYDFEGVAGEPAGNAHYAGKVTYSSPHKFVLDAVPAGANVLDLGSGGGHVATALTRKGCTVTAVDKFSLHPTAEVARFVDWDLDRGLPETVDFADYDYVLMLDVIEHLKDPEAFVAELARRAGCAPSATIIASTGNIGFFLMRLALLFGKFSYAKSGILDRTHTRLFTFATFKALFLSNGFLIERVDGAPPPYPLAIGDNVISRALVAI
ncbi:MAG: glycosyltransferase, partial [Caulobacterales bacterium]